ncbi:MAG: PEP-CTERM sorting domain-containing protein, partial [Roseibacillus sp.]|nr:PEP-CTERM sorting domain-containing protein [Roseibacillus sp.]
LAQITDGNGDSESATGVLAGANGQPIGNVSVAWGVDGSEGLRFDPLGSNSIAISALSVTVPEPSSSSLLLAGVGALLFVRRRR